MTAPYSKGGHPVLILLRCTCEGVPEDCDIACDCFHHDVVLPRWDPDPLSVPEPEPFLIAPVSVGLPPPPRRSVVIPLVLLAVVGVGLLALWVAVKW